MCQRNGRCQRVTGNVSAQITTRTLFSLRGKEDGRPGWEDYTARNKGWGGGTQNRVAGIYTEGHHAVVTQDEH